MSYNRHRDGRRDRSRSRERYDDHSSGSRFGDRDRDRGRDRGGRDNMGKDAFGRDRGREPERDRDRYSRDRDRNSNDRHGRYRDIFRDHDAQSSTGNGDVYEDVESKQRAKLEIEGKQAQARRMLHGQDGNSDDDDEGLEVEKSVGIGSAGVGTGIEGAEQVDGGDDAMMALMGFGGFDSTKGKTVADNVVGAARGSVDKTKKKEYRQYMNRKGGFNKPLAKVA